MFIIIPLSLNAQEISVSCSGGFYPGPLNLKAGCGGCTEVYFTIDGNTPGTSSEKYVSPLYVSKELLISNNIAYIPTTAIPNISDDGTFYTWKEPLEYPKAVALSLRGYSNGNPLTATRHETYFINLPEFDMPIISLVIDPAGLFNEDTGIFVPGIRCDTNNSIWTGNYHMRGRHWERIANLQFFSEEKLYFQQDVGLRIHGSKTRSAPQKSLRIYARDEYGKDYIDYQLFNSNIKHFKRFILQTPFNTHRSNLIGDIVIHELSKPLNVEIMDYNPCVVFINGEYWGLYFIRERLDEYYINNHFGVDPDSVIIRDNSIKVLSNDINDFLEDDLSNDQCYKALQERIDIESFMDYIICETYFRNLDWMANNEGYWKSSAKGKWRFVLFDLDSGFQRYKKNMFDYIEGKEDSPVAALFKALIKNEEFKKDFIRRYAFIVNNFFSPKKVIVVINSVSESIDSEIKRQSYRWGLPESKYKWYRSLDYMKKFANWRAVYVNRHIKEYFDVEETGIKTLRKRIFLNTDLRRGLIPGLVVIFIITFILFSKRREKANDFKV